MGIAAYNRGTRSIQRYFDQSKAESDQNTISLIAERLTKLSSDTRSPGSPHWAGQLGAPTVIRQDGESWWLMHTEQDGWASYGLKYDSLQDIARAWSLTFVDVGRDDCGFFWRVLPA